MSFVSDTKVIIFLCLTVSYDSFPSYVFQKRTLPKYDVACALPPGVLNARDLFIQKQPLK